MSWLNGCARTSGWTLPALSMLAGCDGAQSTLAPAGASAQSVAWIWWGMFWAFSLVLLIVVALWIYAMRRAPQPVTPEQARRIHQRWIIGGGLVLPLASVATLLALGLPLGERLRQHPADQENLLRIEVTSHQWWWEIRYPDFGVITANQLYLPVGVPLEFHLSTADVIHSFWIPRLGGKLDMVPGRVHKLALKADTVGSMRGQCAEFCGTGHAHMILPVEVVEQDKFAAWLRQRQSPVQPDPAYAPATEQFDRHCGDCHRVNGVSQGGSGPDLTDIGARRLLRSPGGTGEPLSIGEWLRRPSRIEPTAQNPDHSQIAPEYQQQIAAWLESLKP